MTITLNKWLGDFRDKHITIADIEEMKPGDKLELLCIDRNFYDLIDHNLNKPATRPELFFQSNYRMEYTHQKDLVGFAKWYDMPRNSESEDDELPICTFHLNYQDEHWYPLDKEGYLPERDPQGYCNFEGIELDWKKYPKQTRIGWRGPMVKWSDVIGGDDIVYNL